ncbi:MAG: hypothetical protein JST85_15850 [Acidobacteria bacterium]|nr:hypothetical protein [Acidobacteriota bacterium]
MPAKVKDMAEATEKAAPEQVAEKQPATSQKQGRPFLAAHTLTSAHTHGLPTAVRADNVFAFTEEAVGNPNRAQMMTAMQRSVGNARLNRMLDTSVASPTATTPTAEATRMSTLRGERPIDETHPATATPTVLKTEAITSEITSATKLAATEGAQKSADGVTESVSRSIGEQRDELAARPPEMESPPGGPATGELAPSRETLSPEAARREENTPSIEGRSVMQQETAEATAAPGIKAEQSDGGPFVLQPIAPLAAEPEPLPPTTGKPSPAEAAAETPTPTPSPQPVDLEANREEAARQSLPSEAAQSLTGSPEAIPPAPEAAAAEAEAATESATPTEETASTTESATPAEEAAPSTEQPIEAAIEGEMPGGGAVPTAGPVVGVKAGMAMVPPPAPETLQAAIPEREVTEEEFLAEFESGRTPEQNRAEAQTMLEGLRTDAEREKAAILGEAEIQKANIAAAAEEQVAAVQAAMETQIASIQSLFASSRATLSDYVGQQKAELQAQIAQQIEQVQTGTAARVADVEAQLTQRQTDLASYGEEQRQQPMAIANEEAERARAELEAAASEAMQAGERVASRYPGDEDPNPDKRAAAREVGSESANDIREKVPAIGDELRAKADEFSGRYSEYATGINTQIEEARPQLILALNDAATSAVATLQQSEAVAMQAMDDRLQVDMQALDAGEQAAINRVQTAGDEAIAQISSGAEQASGEVDAGAAALVTEIDNTVEETVAVVEAEEAPFLPGISDVIEAARASVLETGATGRTQLNTSTSNAQQLLAGVANDFATQAAELTAAAQDSADSILEANRDALSQTVESNRNQAQETITSAATQQQGLVDEALTQIDQGIENARKEMQGVSEQFRSEARQKTDESITEAKKPLTDDTETRAEGAAEEAGGAWYEGLLSALGELIVGFLIMVAVALVVAAIFGLTLGGALLIVGAVFLIVGVIAAYHSRSEQLEREGIPASGGFIFLLALSDATGITGVGEAIYGVDVVTGKTLSDAERTRRGTIGLVTAVGIVFGVRGAIKGPPGGWTRPTSIFRGWSNFSVSALLANVRALAGEVRNIGVSIYKAIRRGIKAIREWFQKPADGEKPPPESPPVDPYSELGARRNLSEEVVNVLREKSVDPLAAERLLDLGMDPLDLGLYADQHGANGILMLDNMTKANVTLRVAMNALDIAHEIGIRSEVINLVNSGNLENPLGLRNFLREVAQELRQGQTGKFDQLMEASQRAAEGHRVSLEGRRTAPGDPESGQADIVDYTTRQAFQMKTVTSPTEEAVIRNLQSAVDQLGGAGGENPPAGYQRVVLVKTLVGDNPLSRASRPELLNAIRGQINHLENLTPPDAPPGEVRITNNRGTFTFSAGELR